jgi:hypothetical protein
MIVSLNTHGEIVKQDLTFYLPYGIAGDSAATSASYMPGVGSRCQNRVSDYYDETKASAKMTVYHSGGEFATDQLSANVAAITTLSAGPTALYAENGMLETSAAQSSVIVARLLTIPGSYASGVPGVDMNGDQALGGNDAGDYTGAGVYAEIKLVI